MTEGGEEATVQYLYHPHELSLKGKNRRVFEEQLSEQLRKQLKIAGVTNFTINKVTGRHFLKAPQSYEKQIEEVNSRVFGIANWSKCFVIERDFELLKTKAFEHVNEILSRREIKSFRVETSRVDKKYHMQSPVVSKEIGTVIHEKLNIPVNLTDPDIVFHIEVLDNTFVYSSEKFPGAQGLPIGSSGKMIVLLSGGFDSPVAAWLMMRRGCNVTYVHFHSSPFGEWRSSVSKIRKIVKQLALWGGPQKFYSIPIGELQRQIATQAPERLRVTLYRRLMMRVAKEIAHKNKCQGLATGDSLGQVASQTVDSMTTIQSVLGNNMLIFRPLLTYTKEEIIKRAEDIGTADFSRLVGGDCCSHMLPKKVATKPTIQDAEDGESKLDVATMVSTAIAAAQVIDINDPWNEDETEQADATCPLFSFKE